MTANKKDLLEQMEQQRTLPITEETFSLYQAYQDLIDPRNPNELCLLFFYQGECYYRLGNFKKSLRFLTRCLKAPKKESFKHLDALSYRIMGMINCYLGSETIALSYIQQCRSVSEELHLKKELISSYIDQGFIYYFLLEDYDNSLDSLNTAFEHVNGLEDGFDALYILCEALRGTLYCKTGRWYLAVSIQQKLSSFVSEHSDPLSQLCMLNLKIWLYEYNKNTSLLEEHINAVINCFTIKQDFIPLSYFYFDILKFLLNHKLQKETLRLLHYIEPYINRCPLFFLKHELMHIKANFTKIFDQQHYPEICSQYISMLPAFEDEQRNARLYNLSYIELLRQTKIASENFQEKSQLDPMTGLLNKYTIQFLIEEDLAKKNTQNTAALLLIDMDHFKQVNDTMGHLMGDAFICQTAAVIQNYYKDTALCGRVGGDEFLVYISPVSDPPFVQLQAEILLQEIYLKNTEKKIAVSTQASIGIAFSSGKYLNFEQLFAAADHALYQAKTDGRAKIVVADL